MQFKDLKYILAYLIPATSFLSVHYAGIWSYLTVLVAFGLIPVFEWMLPHDHSNFSPEEKKLKLASKYFDVLLYVNIVWVYGILFYFLFKFSNNELSVSESLGMILSVGIMMGSNGINVAHELGHKSGLLPQIASKILLLPSMYMHFLIEHNRGHHLRVGTPDDPATSRFNESVYLFWWRSVLDGWKSAWKIESQDLSKRKLNVWSFKNQMIRFTILQCIFLISIALLWNISTVFVAIVTALISILLLETINYVEHYGLLRKQNANGRYENVENFHSWNSEHEVGRILLYELTRHSDHHYKANKKYQILDYYEQSPQLPYGYPTSIMIALLPPLWFQIMNPLVYEWRNKHYNSLFAAYN